MNNVPNKKVKIWIIKMFSELRSKMDEHTEKFKRVRKFLKRQNSLRTIITEGREWKKNSPYKWCSNIYIRQNRL